MMLKLTTEEIVNKQFKKSMRGYDVEQVDEFLNEIIADFDKFEKTLNTLKAQNESLKDQIRRDQIDIDIEKTMTQPMKPLNTIDSDLLKRIANLEKAVFGVR